MIIEKLNKKNIEKVKEFIIDIIKIDFGYELNPDWHWDVIDLQSTYIDQNDSIFYVALDKEKVIGTIAARPYDKNFEIFGNKYNKSNTIGIWRHYIDRNLRRKGIGHKLLEKLEDYYKDSEYKYLYLHTQKTIPGSLEYWLKQNYKITVDEEDEYKTIHLEKIIN